MSKVAFLRSFKATLEKNIEQATKQLTVWAEQFMENPSSAMIHSIAEMTLAARLAGSKSLLTQISGLETDDEAEAERHVEALHGYVIVRLTHLARFPERSTSPTSNMYHTELTAVWAEFNSWF